MANNIFLSLDELFDVRTTVWRTLVDDKTFVKMLDSGYAIRASDRWDQYVPYEKYLKAYEARDVNTLRASTISSIIPVIRVGLSEAITNFTTSPVEKAPIIYLNVTKRYALDDDSLNAIGGSLMTALGIDTSIRITRMEVPFPKDFKNLDIGLAVMYDVVGWISLLPGLTVLDEVSMCPATTILGADIHTSDQPYNLKAMQRACHEITTICKVMADIAFINAAMFTSPILVDIHRDQGAPESSS